MVFIEAHAFTQLVDRYLSHREYLELQVRLVLDPRAGAVIAGTGGFRKLRIADSRRGKGRRGGLRLIYYYFLDESQIWLLMITTRTRQRISPKKRKHCSKRHSRRSSLIVKRKAETDAGAKAGRPVARKTRSIFSELMAGIREMGAHRRGKLTLRSHRVDVAPLPALEGAQIRAVREQLDVSRSVFARLLHVNLRTLERWEQGRGRPNDQAVALILLVQRFPDTLERLETLAAGA